MVRGFSLVPKYLVVILHLFLIHMILGVLLDLVEYLGFNMGLRKEENTSFSNCQN
jgi:hypothetical protein